MVFSHPEQQEQLLLVKEGKRRFALGLPKATGNACPLTILTPEGASMLVSQGIRVLIERGFGSDINYPDDRYTRVGAEVVTRPEAFGADVVLYDGQPDAKEAMMLKPHCIFLTLFRNNILHVEIARIFLERQTTVLALDRVQDHRGFHPVADILDEVSGRAAIATATAFLADPQRGKGILLGGVAGVNPCEVVILGTGMSALAAARSAIGLGGMVRLFDSDPYCLRTAVSELGPAVIGSALHPTVLGHALAAADIVIATRLRSKFAIDESVLDNMKKGVVIFDLNDINGISPAFPSLKCTDVAKAAHAPVIPSSNVCFTNPIGCVTRTAAMALTNDVVPIFSRLFSAGRGIMNTLKIDAGLRASAMFFRGRIVSREVADRLHAKCVDINLILSFS